LDEPVFTTNNPIYYRNIGEEWKLQDNILNGSYSHIDRWGTDEIGIFQEDQPVRVIVIKIICKFRVEVSI
jgi:hypothetical protein